MKESLSSVAKIPFVIKDQLPPQSAERFQKQFIEPGRQQQESLWRRTQEPDTRKYFDSNEENPRRRRIVHGLDFYEVIETDNGLALAVTVPYLWFHVVSPVDETQQYHRQLIESLHAGRWTIEQGGWHSCSGSFRLQDLQLTYIIKNRDDEDIREGREFPPNYNILVVKMSTGIPKTSEETNHPWVCLRSGKRKQDERETPELCWDFKKLVPYFPIQVELGCGPSIEAGIPPLNYMHELYRTQYLDGKFIFGPDKDDFLRDILANPANFYRRAGILYAKALTSEPTPFYLLLKELHGKGIVVGSVITNNFDGLCSRVGIEEMYIRHFDETAIVPQIAFDPAAKSLLVVGLHADRRKVQKQARERGMKLIFVDPEGYLRDGKFSPYPLESTQKGDLLFQMTAQEFTKGWKQIFG